MEKLLGVSYPTVKSRLRALLDKLGLDSLQAEAKRRSFEVVKGQERNEISAQEAIGLLRELEGESV